VESHKQQMWIVDDKGEQPRMVQRQTSYVPGLLKIFDEIIVNAADNIQRDRRGVTQIKVTIDQAKCSIKVWNNGKGVPVVMHPKEKVYVPELIFAHLLTSSNYDDSIKKVTGGRNGFGAKLTNIFSKKFEIECADSKNKKLYK
jgi:DNA topoisomerase-2